jgi:hypothetical protein
MWKLFRQSPVRTLAEDIETFSRMGISLPSESEIKEKARQKLLSRCEIKPNRDLELFAEAKEEARDAKSQGQHEAAAKATVRAVYFYYLHHMDQGRF